MKKLFILSAVAMAVILSGCTSFPTYERTVIRIYDADMNLKEVQEIEHISQMDPIDRPLHPELKKQTYKR